MNFNHVIRITPDEDGVHCGECAFGVFYEDGEEACAVFGKHLTDEYGDVRGSERCRECMAADRECEVQRRIAEALDEYIARRV